MTLTVAWDLKSIFQDPSFQTFSFPYFLITQVILAFHHHLSLFLSSCTLHSLSLIMQILHNTEGKGDSRVASPSLEISKSHLKP